ncbi:hypothetical protein ACQCN2_16205 [Brevibacillus ginsengisoli]|uniref:hypothetical protein n=1 Tax=Brevibacillus ginsengisoli TaxID=363854 RepID=UPI003CF9134E
MNQSFVKKLERIFEKENIKLQGYYIESLIIDALNKEYENHPPQTEFEFNLTFEFDDVVVTFYGEVIEHERENELLSYIPRYDDIKFEREGLPPNWHEFNYTEY